MRFLIPLYSFLFFLYLPAKAQIDSALLVAIGNDNIRAVQERLNNKVDLNTITKDKSIPKLNNFISNTLFGDEDDEENELFKVFV